jgi:hypothetical protein
MQLRIFHLQNGEKMAGQHSSPNETIKLVILSSKQDQLLCAVELLWRQHR